MNDENFPKEQIKTEPDSSTIQDKNNIVDDPVPIGRRMSFSNLRRQLTDEELSSPGVQKLLLDMLEEAEDECDSLKSYVDKYYSADKKTAVLNEKLNKDNKIDVFFGVGVGLGGAILGLIPFLGEDKTLYGIVSAVIGLTLIIGSSIGRLLKNEN